MQRSLLWKTSICTPIPKQPIGPFCKRCRIFHLDFLPKGAIIRKIGVMGRVPERFEGEFEQIFFTREEMDRYVADTCAEIIRRITDKEK